MNHFCTKKIVFICLTSVLGLIQVVKKKKKLVYLQMTCSTYLGLLMNELGHCQSCGLSEVMLFHPCQEYTRLA